MSCIPQAMLMNREKFDSLPDDVQAIIRRYSGVWFVDSYIRLYGEANLQTMRQLESDPKRKVTFPSPADMQTADTIFKSVVDDFAAKSPRNAELVSAARAAVATLRTAR
jgi:TRAP-type C4-dicarboxylate transport system substrate-binding protein